MKATRNGARKAQLISCSRLREPGRRAGAAVFDPVTMVRVESVEPMAEVEVVMIRTSLRGQPGWAVGAEC